MTLFVLYLDTDSIPSSQCQHQVHYLMENPVIFLLNCLLNLQYDKNFYPRLDIEKLYKILTTDNELVLMQPLLAGGSEADRQEKRRTAPSEKNVPGDRYQTYMKKKR